MAQDTAAFYFEKPPDFEFKPGQFADFTLLDPPQTDAEGNIRSFSLASAPFEENLMITTRLRDTAFKRILKAVPPGTELQIEGPAGSLTLHDDAARPGRFSDRRHWHHTFLTESRKIE